MRLLPKEEDSDDSLYGAVPLPLIQRDHATSTHGSEGGSHSWEGTRNQHLAAFLAGLGALCAGAVQGWTAPALPYLLHEAGAGTNYTAGAPAPISADQASWVGAIAALGGLAGALPAGHLADTLGRRAVLLLLSLPFALAWLLVVAFPVTVPALYASRFVAGVAMGAVTVVVPIYNEEIAEDRLRGPLGIYLDLMVTVGILWSYAVGAAVPYVWLAALCGLLPLLFAAAFWRAPESPVFLASRDRWDEAEKALRWLRGSRSLDDQAVKGELVRLHLSVAGVRRHLGLSRLSALRDTARSFYLGSPAGKAAFVVTGLMVVQQLTFINAFLFYTEDIFRGIAGASVSPLTSTVVVGVVQCLATAASFLLVQVCGRRPLLLASALVIALSVGTLAVDLAAAGEGAGPAGWLPLACLCVCMVAYSLGLGPLPWLMMAELAPVEHKGLISSLAVFVNWVLVFAVTFAFNGLVALLGAAATYGGICAACLMGTLFVYLVVPETRGKSREEIQDGLRFRPLVLACRS
ncbi:facilitated trehalose transporter Tret1-2 homolog [Bacillus rossius redtenbacheri]|uniref:facilitated trehalose transporter Tret1-2 homolog n=1 Tax=Bacillus rossius redtenbacheri TaxID=93214 RepID=UPI002FDE88DC